MSAVQTLPRQAVGIDELGKASDLMALFRAGLMSQAICVAAELRLPDLLANGPRSVTELAEATGSHPSSLHRLLRALESNGLCSESDDGTFELGAMGAHLRSDVSNSLRSWTIRCGRHMWPVWGRLRDSVRTGKSAPLLAGGTDGFGHLERDATTAVTFNDAMVELTRLIAGELVRTYDFAGMRRVVDVGGGHAGALSNAGAARARGCPHFLRRGSRSCGGDPERAVRTSRRPRQHPARHRTRVAAICLCTRRLSTCAARRTRQDRWPPR